MKTAISNGINGPGYAEYNSGGYPGTASSGEYFDGEHAKAIFDEAIQMSNFEHINVMKLIGVSFNRSADPEMILPLMDCGDLRNYVKNDQNELFIRDVSKLRHFVKTKNIPVSEILPTSCRRNELSRASGSYSPRSCRSKLPT